MKKDNTDVLRDIDLPELIERALFARSRASDEFCWMVFRHRQKSLRDEHRISITRISAGRGTRRKEETAEENI